MEIHDYKGFTIKIEQDIDPDRPYGKFPHYRLCCRRSQYSFPHDLPKGFDTDATLENLRAYFEAHKYTYLPVYMLSHGGIRLSTTPFTDRWSSTLIGFIYLEPDELTIANDDEQYLKSRLAEFAQWLNGDIYVATITKDDTFEFIGHLYGYDYALQRAKKAVDHHYSTL